MLTTDHAVKEIIRERKEEFFDYLRLASVSTQNRNILPTVKYVEQMIQKTGGETQVLDDCGGNPVVYGYFPAGEKDNPDKTVLFYNHYDVQPEDPLDEWKSEPFEPTVRDGKLFCRGVADNKANFVVRLYAIQALMATEDGLPCNVKFLVEGEEENGSPNLGPYIKKYADLFSSDGCIWEFGGKDEEENFVIQTGVKGMAYFDLLVESANVDIHSSLGAVIDNAAWRLTHALASLKNKENQVLVDGFYDNIEEPSDYAREVVNQQKVNSEKMTKIYGLKHPFITKDLDWSTEEALTFYPTMTISGLLSGYTDEGTKTVLPRKASAKLDCRLVPGQDPKHIEQVIRKHLDKEGFQDVELFLLKGLKAFRSDLESPFLQTVKKAAEKVYGKESGVVLSPTNAGSGPMAYFGEYLNVPVASSGCGYAESKAHGPNESIRLKDFEDGALHMVQFLKDF
ncbi:M20/M25/M40 family metallo-hydrolase [Alkalibacterium sp. 20]|uniref:M20/M25/M40 family metallo-hydrolase n=1 Tax=Alkalibacterium sp. 20 TaxID=1798803 RepID=UPI0009003A4B|nr:M20/M25/M40 family metallo-hydrolase [Alkalibacterium sp. 20]OJF92158.1 acetylornithine deacetylase [Alkalibacterium sp. 20]